MSDMLLLSFAFVMKCRSDIRINKSLSYQVYGDDLRLCGVYRGDRKDK